MTVAGPSQSGQSSLIRQIIQHRDVMIKPAVRQILWCYVMESSWMRHFNNNVSFHEGLPDALEDLPPQTLLVLDDLQGERERNGV